MSQYYRANQEFDPDTFVRKVIIKSYSEHPKGTDFPWHSHQKNQLVLPIKGAISSEVEDAIWMVPNQCGLWIPAGQMHLNTPTTKSCFHHIYFSTDVLKSMPDFCCTLSITPLIRELVEHLATLDQFIALDSDTDRIADVLTQQLSLMTVQQLNFAIPRDQRLKVIAKAMIDSPSDRRTVDEWATSVAMSERSLARLIVQETGLTFGRWRQQLHIIKALQRLSDNAPVQSIAEELGYESVSAFIYMFKKVLGQSPGKYISDNTHFTQ